MVTLGLVFLLRRRDPPIVLCKEVQRCLQGPTVCRRCTGKGRLYKTALAAGSRTVPTELVAASIVSESVEVSSACVELNLDHAAFAFKSHSGTQRRTDVTHEVEQSTSHCNVQQV